MLFTLMAIIIIIYESIRPNIFSGHYYSHVNNWSISWFDKCFINMPFLIRLMHIIFLLELIGHYNNVIIEYIGWYTHAFCYNYAIIIIIYERVYIRTFPSPRGISFQNICSQSWRPPRQRGRRIIPAGAIIKSIAYNTSSLHGSHFIVKYEPLYFIYKHLLAI